MLFRQNHSFSPFVGRSKISQDSKKYIAEFKEWDDAMDCAEAAIEGKTGVRYIVEETNGTVNSYGELIASVVAESDFN